MYAKKVHSLRNIWDLSPFGYVANPVFIRSDDLLAKVT